MLANGLAQRCIEQLAGVNIAAAIFSGVQPDPTEQNVLDGLAQFRAARADLIVALGGGSPIDCATRSVTMLMDFMSAVRSATGPEKVPP